jgi:hypothetical protein
MTTFFVDFPITRTSGQANNRQPSKLRVEGSNPPGIASISADGSKRARRASGAPTGAVFARLRLDRPPPR